MNPPKSIYFYFGQLCLVSFNTQQILLFVLSQKVFSEVVSRLDKKYIKEIQKREPFHDISLAIAENIIRWDGVITQGGVKTPRTYYA